MWRQGWLQRARALPSPNFGVRPPGLPISLIVLHSISLPPGRFEGDFVQALFTNTLDWDAHPDFDSIRGMQVSAHFYIRRSGELWQFVDCQRRAWHAGVSRHRGRANCNDFSIGIELEGADTDPYEDAQYESLAALLHGLLDAYPTLAPDRLVGHDEIAPGRKTDPGVSFDWPRLRRLVAHRPTGTTQKT